ncbi:MAG: NitT/TauT family transport system substrate-binding protein [Rhizobacter sp.]|nr:NitT/TauT family transport system substrate-binding protein [Rhizobacter sp.]
MWKPLGTWAAKIGASLLMSALAASGAWAQPVKLKVGAYASISDAPLYIGVDKGFFKEQGLNVEIVEINSGATMMTQLATGDLDASGGSPGAGVYNAVRQGLAFKIVADKGSSLPGHGYFAFVVRKDLADQIKRPADLKGRLLAVTGYKNGASSEVTVHKLLASDGVKDSEVNQINMSFGDIVSALGTKKVDVGVLIEPLVTQAVSQGIGTMWKRVDDVYPNQQYGALMYGPGIIKQPEVAKKFMVAYLKAARYYNDALSNKIPRDELIAILTKHTSVKNPELYKTMVFPGIDPDGKLNTVGMQGDVDWWVSAGRMKEKVNLADIVDTSYADFAKKQLGAYR